MPQTTAVPASKPGPAQTRRTLDIPFSRTPTSDADMPARRQPGIPLPPLVWSRTPVKRVSLFAHYGRTEDPSWTTWLVVNYLGHRPYLHSRYYIRHRRSRSTTDNRYGAESTRTNQRFPIQARDSFLCTWRKLTVPYTQRVSTPRTIVTVAFNTYHSYIYTHSPCNNLYFLLYAFPKIYHTVLFPRYKLYRTQYSSYRFYKFSS
jgi:hypothetical protein